MPESSEVPPDSPEEQFIAQFLRDVQKTHVLADCLILTPTGQNVTLSPHDKCFFYPNGNSFRYESGTLTLFDKNMKKLNENGPVFLHHQLSQSLFGSDILGIESVYINNKKMKIRTDQVSVFDKTGKRLKSFSFYDYFRKRKVKPVLNTWTPDENKNSTYEISHVNSFKELYKTDSRGNNVLTSYVAHDNHNNVIFILNKALTKIERTIQLKQKAAHDIQPYNDHQLIYYMNEDASKPEPRLSSIEIFDLKKNNFQTLYQIKTPEVSARACSSVQFFGTDKLFITHSKCSRTKEEEKAYADYYFEYVDLKNNKSVVIPVRNRFVPQGAYLIDATSFLKNNPGI
ncbi:MAG: hypothetical protein ACXWQQ_02035 [Pseudobdellovibrio sp.]